MESSKQVFDILKSCVNPNDFDEEEKIFYNQQCLPSREGYVSDLINIRYQQSTTIERDTSLEVLEELSGQSETEEINTAITLRSGHKLPQIVCDAETQTEYTFVPKPDIRNIRNCTNEIKDACCIVSIKCGISLQKARLAVQVVPEVLYGHAYVLQPQGEGEEEEVQGEVVTSPKSKKTRCTKEDYKPYKDCLPSLSVLRDHKHRQVRFSLKYYIIV